MCLILALISSSKKYSSTQLSYCHSNLSLAYFNHPKPTKSTPGFPHLLQLPLPKTTTSVSFRLLHRLPPTLQYNRVSPSQPTNAKNSQYSWLSSSPSIFHHQNYHIYDSLSLPDPRHRYLALLSSSLSSIPATNKTIKLALHVSFNPYSQQSILSALSLSSNDREKRNDKKVSLRLLHPLQPTRNTPCFFRPQYPTPLTLRYIWLYPSPLSTSINTRYTPSIGLLYSSLQQLLDLPLSLPHPPLQTHQFFQPFPCVNSLLQTPECLAMETPKIGVFLFNLRINVNVHRM